MLRALAILILTIPVILLLLLFGGIVWAFISPGVREYRYDQADKRARELGWADYNAMVQWQREQARNAARRQAEARDA